MTLDFNWKTVLSSKNGGHILISRLLHMRLCPDDWLSGDNVWLLDVVAADRKQATSVLANFRQLAGERPIKIAPTVARLIDPEVLERIRVAAFDV